MPAATQETSVPVCCRWPCETGADAPDSLPALLPQIKSLIPAAQQLPSRVNSQSGSRQNNEGLCAGPGPGGGGDLEPALWSGARTRCTLHGPETCANTALRGTDARQRGPQSTALSRNSNDRHPPELADGPYGTRAHAHDRVARGRRGRPSGAGGGGRRVAGGAETGWESGEQNGALPASHRPSEGDRVSGAQGCEAAHGLCTRVPRAEEEGMRAVPSSAARYPPVVSISRKPYSNSIRFYKIRPAHCPPEFLSRQPPASFPNWPSALGPARQPPLPPPPGCLVPGHFLLPFLVSPETLPVSPASRPRGGPREPPNPGQHWAASPTDAGCPLVFSGPRAGPPKKGGLPRARVSSWGLHGS